MSLWSGCPPRARQVGPCTVLACGPASWVPALCLQVGLPGGSLHRACMWACQLGPCTVLASGPASWVPAPCLFVGLQVGPCTVLPSGPASWVPASCLFVGLQVGPCIVLACMPAGTPPPCTHPLLMGSSLCMRRLLGRPPQLAPSPPCTASLHLNAALHRLGAPHKWLPLPLPVAHSPRQLPTPRLPATQRHGARDPPPPHPQQPLRCTLMRCWDACARTRTASGWCCSGCSATRARRPPASSSAAGRPTSPRWLSRGW